MANYNIYIKNNFNHLVMNKTQYVIEFPYRKNVHIWHLIKVNHREVCRSLKFLHQLVEAK